MAMRLLPNAVQGGMTLLSNTTLTGSSVTISNIPLSYKHLYVTVHDVYAAATAVNMTVRMNGDTGANYSWNILTGATLTSGIGETSMRTTVIYNTGGSFAGELIIQIPNYTDTTGIQLAQTNGWLGNSRNTQNATGVYHNRSAGITSLTFLTATSSFSSGTVRLYGVN
jgi:hypothetical protein